MAIRLTVVMRVVINRWWPVIKSTLVVVIGGRCPLSGLFRLPYPYDLCYALWYYYWCHFTVQGHGLKPQDKTIFWKTINGIRYLSRLRNYLRLVQLGCVSSMLVDMTPHGKRAPGDYIVHFMNPPLLSINAVSQRLMRMSPYLLYTLCLKLPSVIKRSKWCAQNTTAVGRNIQFNQKQS